LSAAAPRSLPHHRLRGALRRRALAALTALVALPLTACDGRAQAGTAPAARSVRELPALSDSAWAGLVQSLSEEGGYFDTDNLISNERSYLHVVGPLRRMRGGAYIGVGPDQSFSYLAAARPAIAFIVDIRRDNLLHHLLLRSLFALSSNRAEYLARLHGRALPDDPRAWDGRPLEAILDRLDSLPADPAAVRATALAVDSILRALPLPVTDADLATIERFHREFIDGGTALRFRTFGREPRPYYPTYRQLLLETDASGRPASFVVDEESFRWVKELERRNLVVPVVGDLAGPHALRAIGAWLDDRDVGVSAYYTSNVEDYVWRDGKYDAFLANVRALPWARDGVIIRSYFHNGPGSSYGLTPPPNSYSSQILQPVGALLEAAASPRAVYEQVITAGMLPLR
jgi:hypothetical protein